MFGLFTTGGRIGESAIALLIYILVSWYKTNSFVLVQVGPPWFGLPDRGLIGPFLWPNTGLNDSHKRAT